MPEISIIVPVYNVEKYLKKCIDSVLNQSFTDFELILVDDGSNDNSADICDSYIEVDNRIKVIHKENGGLSSARNAGIRNSKGKYIGFIDSDDYISKDMYELLYSDIKKEDADISICGICECFGDKRKKQSNFDGRVVLNNSGALKEVMESKMFSVNAVNKLYKKSLFDEIKYPEGRLSEDAFITPLLIIKAKKIVFNSRPEYYYVHRSESITTSKFKKNDFDVIDAYKGHLKLINDKFPEYKNQAMFRYLWSYMYVLDKMILSENFDYDLEYKNTISILRKNTFNILKNPFFSFKRKLASIILLFNESLYRKVTKKNKEKNYKLCQ